MRRIPSALVVTGYLLAALLLGWAGHSAYVHGLAALLAATAAFVSYRDRRQSAALSVLLLMAWLVGSSVAQREPGDASLWLPLAAFAPIGALTLLFGRALVARLSPGRALIAALACACGGQLLSVLLELRASGNPLALWFMLLMPAVYLAVLAFVGFRENSDPAAATGTALLAWLIVFIVSLYLVPVFHGASDAIALAALLVGPLLYLLQPRNIPAIAAVTLPAAQPAGDNLHDALTGAYNRRALDTEGARVYSQSLASDRPASVLMLDIDHFKHVNDLYGHAAGDLVLQKFAQVVSAQVRGTDFVARYGGEEFAIILPSAPLAPAMRLAEQMRKAVQECELEHKGRKLKITTSVGVTSAFPGDEGDFAAALARADRNLYRAKRYGRNRVMADPLPGEI